jgi:hypothetical protein
MTLSKESSSQTMKKKIQTLATEISKFLFLIKLKPTPNLINRRGADDFPVHIIILQVVEFT